MLILLPVLGLPAGTVRAEESLSPPEEKTPQRVWAENLGDNRIRITSEFTRRLRVYLHPKMVDFARPVKIVANGKTVFRGKVRPSLRTMLELVREFDDRGRIFHAAVEVEIPTDLPVPEPRGEAPVGPGGEAGGDDEPRPAPPPK
jgi:hypothetical protein